jgi:hypothetical protein
MIKRVRVKRTKFTVPTNTDRSRRKRDRAAVSSTDDHEQLSNRRTVEQWAVVINAAWQKQVGSILEFCRLVRTAREELDEHGEWSKFFNEWGEKKLLSFGKRTADRLIAIAEHPVLSNETHVSRLPPSWGTLYELTKIEDKALEVMLKDGTIHTDIQRREVEEIIARMKDEGIFLWPELRRSVRVLINFMHQYPNAKDIAWEFVNSGYTKKKKEEPVDLKEMAALLDWLPKLHAGAKPFDDVYDWEREASSIEDTDATVTQEDTEQQPNGNDAVAEEDGD